MAFLFVFVSEDRIFGEKSKSMRITTDFLLFFTVILLGLSACSKEKKIERSLRKKDGVWEVTNYHYLSYYYTGEDTLVNEKSIDNYGTFRFHNNGHFQSTGQGTWNNYEGTWMNTENELVITGKDVDYYGSAKVYRISEQSGNQMTLKRTARKLDIPDVKLIETLQLKRRD